MKRKSAFTLVLAALVLVALLGFSQAAFAQSISDCLNNGLDYMNQGSFDDAIAEFSKVIGMDSNNDAAYFDRGLAYVKKGNSTGETNNYDLALADFNKVLGIIGPSHPKLSEVHVGIANAYHGKGDLDASAAEYGKAIQVNPNDSLAYENRGLINFKRQKFDESLADYNKAIELDPGHAEAYLERGVVLMQKADSASDDLALADFSKTIDLSSDNGRAYVYRAMMYYIKQEYDKSWNDVHKAQSLGVDVDEKFIEGLTQVSGKSS